MSLTHYESNKLWRQTHPETWYKNKRNYYRRNAGINPVRGGKRWTDEEKRMVLEHKLSDRELAEKFQRTISAVQSLRSNLKDKASKNFNESEEV